MSTSRTCPQCQQPLSADAPEGLCPACVMQNLAATAPAPPLVDIADQAEIARRLPQLEIIELLGRGGMGVVYRARQKQLDREVALKILPPQDSLSPDFIERFRREARSLAKLSHPNIVTVHDFGESEGIYYFIMELVDGANLRQLLQSKKLTAAEALAIVPKVCDALEYAHEVGVVHRDIKPENILVDRRGQVKIADFGLAKLLRREALDMTLTLAGSTLGTLRYMAPEQVDRPETVDHRADIYSLGVVFYEMLTGETPVGRFPLPSQKANVDARLDKIVLHALEKEPDHRYQHASEVKTDVESVAHGPAQAAAKDQRETKASPARRVGFAAVALMALMLGWLAVAALWNFRTPGCLLGSTILAAITTEIAFRRARRNPVWASTWRSAGLSRQINYLSQLISALALLFMLLISVMDIRWERSPLRANHAAVSRAQFEERYRGKEYQLIRQLTAYKDQVPTTEMLLSSYNFTGGWHFWPVGAPTDSFGWISIVPSLIVVLFGMAAMFQQYFAMEGNFGWWKIYRGAGWRPALALTGTVLLSALLAYGVLDFAYFAKRGDIFSSRGKTFLVNASMKEVAAIVNRWTNLNGYAMGDEYTWNFQTVPKGEQIATAEVVQAWKPSPFDRWQMTPSGLRRISPHLAIEIVSSDKPVESFVSITENLRRKTAGGRDEQWEDEVESLYKTIWNATHAPAEKPQAETAKQSPRKATSPWLIVAAFVAVVVLWAAIRARVA